MLPRDCMRMLSGPDDCDVLAQVWLLDDAAQEPVHKLAWTLDACLKDRKLDERRLREIAQFLSSVDRQAASQAAMGALDWDGPALQRCWAAGCRYLRHTSGVGECMRWRRQARGAAEEARPRERVGAGRGVDGRARAQQHRGRGGRARAGRRGHGPARPLHHAPHHPPRAARTLLPLR